MNGRELADAVSATVPAAPYGVDAEAYADIIEQCRLRILGAQPEYAEHGQQKFERMRLQDLLRYQEEELLDQINYSVMNILRIRKVIAAIDNLQAGFSIEALAELARSFIGEVPANPRSAKSQGRE